MILATFYSSLLLFAISVESSPLLTRSASTLLHERARFPGSIGPPNPPPLCNTQTSDPSLADCEIAVKRAAQQYISASDGKASWNFVAAFEFHDATVAPSFGDPRNAIALPRVTRFGSCILLLSMNTQSLRSGWATTAAVKNDRATWFDIRAAAAKILHDCKITRGYRGPYLPTEHPTGGSQLFGEFNSIQVTLFTPWSPYEVFGFDHTQEAVENHAVTSYSNNGAYQAIWNENEWPHPTVPTDDDDSETSQYDPTSDEGDVSATPQMGYSEATSMDVHSTGSESPSIEERPTYTMQMPDQQAQDYVNAVCAITAYLVHIATVVIPDVVFIIFGLLMDMMPLVISSCEPK